MIVVEKILWADTHLTMFCEFIHVLNVKQPAFTGGKTKSTVFTWDENNLVVGKKKNCTELYLPGILTTGDGLHKLN